MTQLGAQPKPKIGRKRDRPRDPEILDAALDALAETGYDGMTMDMVAARAKAGKATLYRRWASKGELIVDAIRCLKTVNLETLPDTGTLRGNFLATIKPPTIGESAHKLKIITGLVSVLSREHDLATTALAEMSEPRIEANRIFFRCALARGKIAVDINIDSIALVIQAMATYRVMILREPATRWRHARNVNRGALWPDSRGDKWRCKFRQRTFSAPRRASYEARNGR